MNQHAFLAIVTAGAALLILGNITNSYLWQDEASTALLGRSVLDNGFPRSHDGPNSLSHEHGRDMTAGGVFKWQPWLPFYVTAGSFALLGESTVSARLPFALFGVATVVMTYVLARAAWREEGSARGAAFTLLFSTPFLLLAGQARYYSLSMFLTAAALWALIRWREGWRYGGVLFAICALFLMHTNHAFGLALLLGAGIHAFVWRSDTRWRVAGLCAAILLIHVPWLMWLSDVPYGERGVFKTVRLALIFIVELALTAPHPIFLIALLLLIRGGRRYWSDRTALFALVTLVLIVLVSMNARQPYFRYLAPVLPLGSVVAGKVLSDAWKARRAWGIGLAAAFVVVSQFPLYLYEMVTDYDGPVEGIVRYLEEHAEAGDVVAINYGDFPVKFYTDLRVVGGYTGEDVSLAHLADWVIPRREGYEEQRAYYEAMVKRGNYERIVLDGYPDVLFENRESPFEHRFWTARGVEPVVMYRRRDAESR